MRSVAFGIDDTGIVVDTHVHKISAALNWTLKAKRPEESRLQLQRWVPKGEWTHFTLSIVGFGQTIKTKNWKEHFLMFSKNQNTLELGEDIVNRLVWSGCKIGQGADMKSNSGGYDMCPFPFQLNIPGLSRADTAPSSDAYAAANRTKHVLIRSIEAA